MSEWKAVTGGYSKGEVTLENVQNANGQGRGFIVKKGETVLGWCDSFEAADRIAATPNSLDLHMAASRAQEWLLSRREDLEHPTTDFRRYSPIELAKVILGYTLEDAKEKK